MLTDIKIKNLKPTDKKQKISAGGGLFLFVTTKGKKSWVFIYRENKKQTSFVLGEYPYTSLAKARLTREKSKEMLANGICPKSKFSKNYQKKAQEKLTQETFEYLASVWFEKSQNNKVQTTKFRTKRLLENDIFPFIAKKHVKDISTEDLLKIVQKIENRGVFETAKRTINIVKRILKFSLSMNIDVDPKIFNFSNELFTKVEKKHFAAITDKNGAKLLMQDIYSYNGHYVTCQALKLIALFFVRSKELRFLRWGDVDFAKKQILIPAKRMKMRQDHIIPLAKQAINILKDLKKQTFEDEKSYLFPSNHSKSKPISDNCKRLALRRLGYSNDDMTVHGFRAMARTLLDEELGFRVDYIEQQLAHSVRDPNGRAYNRTKHLNERFEMMQKWADFLYELKS